MTVSMADIQRVGVVGAGAMGTGIAQVLLLAGFEVRLQDERREALAKAHSEINERIGAMSQKGRIDAVQARNALGRLITTEQLGDLAPSQLCIEAIFEDLPAKQKLFTDLEKIVTSDAIIASNTSSLSIAAIGRFCRHRERICGLHFFNPVPLMRLVEVIAGPVTSGAHLSTALELVRRIGKTPVLAKDGPGFLVNLGGRAYTTEALHIEREGVASVPEIDQIMKEAIGFRMGPFELMDLTGIDVNYPVTNFIYEGHQHDPRLKTTPLHAILFAAGRFGRKSGHGFHSYEGSPAAPAVEHQTNHPTATDLQVMIPVDHPSFSRLRVHGLMPSDIDYGGPILVAPFGEDATTVACRLACPADRLVAVDFTGLDRKFLTLMAPPGQSHALSRVANWAASVGFRVAVIGDSPGFVAQRILAMIVNLGCEMAQMGSGTPADIDIAMKLGLNYPYGPIELGDALGPHRVHETLRNLQAITGSERYRPSLWLRRRALLNLPLGTPDRHQ